MMVLSFDVTRRKLALGSANATTGWYVKSYTESTIEMIIFPRAAQKLAVDAGVYVRLDAVGLTADPVEEGDQIEDANSVIYEVKTVKPHYFGDSFMWRECDLEELKLYQEG
jgi:hypothetical protein